MLSQKSQHNMSWNCGRLSTLKKALVKSSSFRSANLLCHKRPIPPLLLLWIGAEDWFIVKSLLKRDCLVVGCLGNSWTFCVSTKEIIESLRNHWGRKSLCSMGDEITEFSGEEITEFNGEETWHESISPHLLAYFQTDSLWNFEYITLHWKSFNWSFT